MRHLIQVIDARKNGAGYAGSCTHCGKPATKEAQFDEQSVIIIEKYCDACSEPSMFEKLQEWYSRV